MNHDHELDDKLHAGCPMCDEIRSRLPKFKTQVANEKALSRYAELADRTNPANQAANEIREAKRDG